MAEWDNRVPVPCVDPELGEEGEFGLVWFYYKAPVGCPDTKDTI